MLEDLGWVGKLPNYSDYIQSNHLFDVQRSLMNWLERGQDHIGEQLFKFSSSEDEIYIYYFFLESYISDHKRIHGLFFSSRDSSGRKCPFIIFTHNHTVDPIENLNIFQDKLMELGFSWNMLSIKFSNNFFDSIQAPLSELSVSNGFSDNGDSWFELYPNVFKLNFKIESTNHVVYRKLLIR